ncbi:serine hydrolase domain-containing protein [Lactobacillus sp.]|uniref:serine hydrolase domain-containing protein n=1 Tax=Lactobacillus sp. TaxID=1591 RepID=UPI0025C1683C|nr:serine hydrolase domain-containing protein [Lactobacillus sp.]
MKINKKLIAIATALTVGVTPFAAFSSTSNNTVHAASMKKIVENTMKKNHVRGSILVVKNGESQVISYGYANYSKKILNSNKQVAYPIASLQKVVTAAMLIQIMQEKKGSKQAFSQNTKISRWYPTLKNANKITVGHLLTHTSGINLVGTEANRGYTYSEQGAINWLIKHINSTPQAQIGKQFNYNNANYILLMGIIRKLTNHSYATNLNNRIVKPLKLQNTFLATHTPTGKIKAVSYMWNGKHNYQNSLTLTNTVASQLTGAGDLYTTPGEYYKIQQGLTNGKILTKNQFDYMTHLTTKVTTYSGGMYIKKNGELKLAYGSSQHTHFCNWIQLTDDNQNGIIMFLNQSQGNKNAEKAVGYQILNKIKPNYFKKN